MGLFVSAVFPGAPEIGVADPPAPPSLLTRLARRHTAHLYSSSAVSSTDGLRIRLPAVLAGVPTTGILDRYRLLALEQAARASRGTPMLVPADEPLLRDLYLLSEAAAVDSLLVGLFPSLQSSLQQARLEAVTDRPHIPRASGQEVAAEALLCALLAAHPALPPAPFLATGTADASLRWAETQDAELRSLTGPTAVGSSVPLGCHRRSTRIACNGGCRKR